MEEGCWDRGIWTNFLEVHTSYPQVALDFVGADLVGSCHAGVVHVVVEVVSAEDGSILAHAVEIGGPHEAPALGTNALHELL